MGPLNFQCVRKTNVSNLHLATSTWSQSLCSYLRSFASERRKNVAEATMMTPTLTLVFRRQQRIKSKVQRIFSLVRFWTTSDFIHRTNHEAIPYLRWISSAQLRLKISAYKSEFCKTVLKLQGIRCGLQVWILSDFVHFSPLLIVFYTVGPKSICVF